MAELEVGQAVRLRDQPGWEGVIVGGSKEEANGERSHEIIEAHGGWPGAFQAVEEAKA